MLRKITIKPIISEKSLRQANVGWYTFAVDNWLDKKLIKNQIEKLFPVNVEEVRTVSMHGKMKRRGKKMRTIKRMDWKKALIMLKKGQKIDTFDITGEQK